MFSHSIKTFITFPLFIAAAIGSSNAQPITNQDLVLDCLARIGDETTWQECRGMMFAPCQEHKIGTDTHAACLLGEKNNWENKLTDIQEELVSKLTKTGNGELAELMSSWVEFRDARCSEVSASNASAEKSVRLGCEITEIAGLSAEFQACLEGRSTTQYCVLKES